MKTYGDFELVGYHVDYYQDGKFMGSVRIEKKDRPTCGYQSRILETANQNITIKKNKTIRKGTEFYTELIPLCGKVVGDIFEVGNLKKTKNITIRN
jgi:hypothetical protein